MKNLFSTKLFKGVMMFAMLFAASLFWRSPAYANDYSYTLNDGKSFETPEFTLAEGKYNRYYIQLDKPGRLAIELKLIDSDENDIEIYSNDGTKLCEEYCYATDTSKLIDLEKGTYFIKITNYDIVGNDRSYVLKASFTATKNQDVEPNNTFFDAQTLPKATWVRGFISKTDDCDYYKLAVPAGCKAQLYYSAENETVQKSYLSVYDENQVEKVSKTEVEKSYQTSLPGGSTYYIKVEGYEPITAFTYVTGTYKLRWEIIKQNNSITTSNSSYKLSLAKGKLSLGATAKTSLSYASSNSAIATVASNGVVTAKKAGTVMITIKAAETDYYKAATKTVTVNVVKATQAPKVNYLKKTVSSKKTNTYKLTVSNVKDSAKASFKKVSGNGKIKIASNGKVTVLKGLKKGKYSVKVKMTVKATAKYNTFAKTYKMVVTVK